MKPARQTTEARIGFIALYFPKPEEQTVAVLIARHFAGAAGDRITELRPATRLSEILEWMGTTDRIRLIMTLEESFGREIGDEFAADFGNHSFRELVEHFSSSVPMAERSQSTYPQILI